MTLAAARWIAGLQDRSDPPLEELQRCQVFGLAILSIGWYTVAFVLSIAGWCLVSMLAASSVPIVLGCVAGISLASVLLANVAVMLAIIVLVCDGMLHVSGASVILSILAVLNKNS